MISITNQGFNGKGVYVGRPSVFGNPFPIKVSKYSKKIYSIHDSLNLYMEYFKQNLLWSEEFRNLINQYRKNNFIQLDCWCINSTLNKDTVEYLEVIND